MESLESRFYNFNNKKLSNIESKNLKDSKKIENIESRFYKFLLALFILLNLTHIINANGFKIQEQSLNATALSSAYVAGARGADASYYNPANMGFLNDYGENKHEFEFDFSIINIPGFKFKVPSTNQGLSSFTYMEYDIAPLRTLRDSCRVNGVPLCPGVGPAIYNGVMGGNLIPTTVPLQHSPPDLQVVDGSTGDTNFMLPKFFYKSKNYSGFTFGASFIAPSGLAMKWNGKGGEFLQDVMIFLIEFAPAISYTYKDIFSVGLGWRILYGMGTFNNIVYVPLGISSEQSKNDISTDDKQNNIWLPEQKPVSGKNCTPSFDPDILQSLPGGLIPPEMESMLDMVKDNPVLYPILGLPPNASQLDVIKAMVAKIQTCLVGTAQVIQQSNGSDLSIKGWRIGASVKVGKGGMFSILYNSDVPMRFEGNVVADTVIGGPVGSVRMEAPLYLYVTMPQILTVAYAHEFKLPNEAKLRLEAVYERTFWSQGRKFDTEFGCDSNLFGKDVCTKFPFVDMPGSKLPFFTASPGSVPESFEQAQLMGMVGLADFTAVKMGNGWVDTDTFRLGMSYIGKKLRLMVSCAYDKAPVPQTAIGIPDSDGYMIGVGAKYNFRGFDIGAGLSQTFKDSSRSVYAGTGVGQLRIATFSIGYRW
ncbi:hypothetical protein DCO58_05475 [Helicobacter saguini]|uniref:Transporter n=2 Tax=Helicobacter saguini TaxID=1548018 RepID=A0A347W757_9HELI|nr:hypothetical protein [Helicobacter saguini]MWV67127.1 hypothetical protein [Helicobacter saguini]MWV69477.1 hypothetical protein [Helicobacter saguini]MWV70970.1 hypothetical protein [Helicobacter saguini]TLD92961.1 hypothetical protein LS64_009655 [Helicobacter saguini]